MNLAQAATQAGLSLVDISIMVGVAAAIFGIVSQVGRFVTEYIALKVGNTSKAKEIRAEEIRQTQSESCKFDHSSIRTILAEQNANIVRLLDQHAMQVKAFVELAHAFELKHHTTMNQLQRIWEHLPKRRNDSDDNHTINS
jgi:hypothetical protein